MIKIRPVLIWVYDNYTWIKIKGFSRKNNLSKLYIGYNLNIKPTNVLKILAHQDGASST